MRRWRFQKRLGETELTGTSYRLLGVTYAFLGRRDSALTNFENALAEFTTIDDARGMATTNQAIGTVFAMQGKYEDAISRILEAIPQFESINDSLALGVAYFNIANMYAEQALHAEAIIRFEKAGTIYTEAGHPNRMPRVYTGLAQNYERVGEIDKALENLELGLESAQKYRDLLSLRNLNITGAKIHIGMEEYATSKTYSLAALDLNKRTGSNPTVALDPTQTLAVAEFRLNNISSAKTYIEQVLNNPLINSGGREGLKIESLILYSDIEAKLGNGLKAHDLVKQAKAISDSLTKVENAQAIAELETIYETEKKEAQIRFLEVENEVANLRALIIGVVGGFLVLIALTGSWLVYRKRANERKAKMEGLKKELQQFGLVLAEKNNFIAGFKDDLEEVRRHVKTLEGRKELTQLVDTIHANTNLTDDEDILFTKVETGKCRVLCSVEAVEPGPYLQRRTTGHPGSNGLVQ